MLTPEQKLPVYAVISNQNTANTLLPLLSSLYQTEGSEQLYDGVVVVDGYSNDNSKEVVQAYQAHDPNLDWIGLQASVGSSNLKNKGADHVQSKAGQAIMHFMEADMELANGVSAPGVANNLVAQPNTAFVGGLIKNPNGTQHALNYGPSYSLATYGKAALQQFTGGRTKLRERFLQDFPDPNAEPTARTVGWIMERNMLITTSMFEALGGFDPSFQYRHHDAQPLAFAAARQHLDVRFDPSFAMTQLPATSDRLKAPRVSQMLHADAHLIGKHVGLRNFVRPKR